MNRMIIDTETAGTFGKSLVYDFGGVVVNGNGEQLASFNFVIDDVYYGMPKKMATAYYAEKLPAYDIEIALGVREVVSMVTAWNKFHELAKKYNVREVWAFNARFDMGALNYTINLLSNGFVTDFFGSLNVKCIMACAQSTLCKSRNYFKSCVECGQITDSGNVRTTAESVYQFVSGCKEFAEAHTALEDALIETVILFACLKRKQKMNTKPQMPTGGAWREVQALFKGLN